jgi:hypothetical protein
LSRSIVDEQQFPAYARQRAIDRVDQQGDVRHLVIVGMTMASSAGSAATR